MWLTSFHIRKKKKKKKKKKKSNGNKMSMKRIFDSCRYVCRIVFHEKRLAFYRTVAF